MKTKKRHEHPGAMKLYLKVPPLQTAYISILWQSSSKFKRVSKSMSGLWSKAWRSRALQKESSTWRPEVAQTPQQVFCMWNLFMLVPTLTVRMHVWIMMEIALSSYVDENKKSTHGRPGAIKLYLMGGWCSPRRGVQLNEHLSGPCFFFATPLHLQEFLSSGASIPFQLGDGCQSTNGSVRY